MNSTIERLIAKIEREEAHAQAVIAGLLLREIFSNSPKTPLDQRGAVLNNT